MKLLIITQKIDKEDPVLGFFHDWVLKLSEKFEKISVICLEKGRYNLPSNVKIYSLGKESGRNKTKYIFKFFTYIIGLALEYDRVFVHMNQEYVLLGGFIWKILRKKVYFWRNHPQGNILTKIAVWFSHKVFCTSKHAFVAKSSKIVIMPVGVDTERFKDLKIERLKNSILFLGRMDKIKRLDLLVEALNILEKRRIDFVCDFYGDPTPETGDYFDTIKRDVEKSNLKEKINFYDAIPNYKTPEIYNKYSIYVNLTPSGSFDKTILEASACGCLLVIGNKSLLGEVDERMIIESTAEDVAERIYFWLNVKENEKKEAGQKLTNYVINKHSLKALIEKLYEQIFC